jgi:hypothetical protein
MTTRQITLDGRFLVRGNELEFCSIDSDDIDEEQNRREASFYPLWISDVSLSFWGGVDPETGQVVDTTHPWYNRCVTDAILCMPSGRGSCTASQVLLELILKDMAPKAILLRDTDGLVCVGSIIAQEIFQISNKPDILVLGNTQFQNLIKQTTSTNNSSTLTNDRARVLPNGQIQIILSNSEDATKEPSVWQETESSETVLTRPESKNNNNLSTFSRREERMLYQCKSEAERMALRVIFRYAKILTHNHPHHWDASIPSSSLSESSTNPGATSLAMSSSTAYYLTISQAHIDGCTYIGPGGLEFVQRLVAFGGHVRVPTTLNSVSVDRQHWQRLGVPRQHAIDAIALGDAYLELGCQPSFTCAPYLLPSKPVLGQDICWGESNAVVYANSVLGARTEKYADYLDICCAIAGIVPAVGVHLTENRTPGIILDATELFSQHTIPSDTTDSSSITRIPTQMSTLMETDLLFPTLGHLCGSLSDGKVPILIGLERHAVSADHLKAFCAAFGTTASSPLIHIAGITPEAKEPETVQRFIQGCGENVVKVTRQQLFVTFTTLNGKEIPDASDSVKIDLVALGNPHLSVTECQTIADIILQNHATPIGETMKSTTPSSSTISKALKPKRHPDTRLIGCISRTVFSQVDPKHLAILADFGMEFVFDTCWCMLLHKPIIPPSRNATIMTNSGKYAHYGPGLTQRKFRFGSMDDCIRAARTGRYPISNARSISTLGMSSRTRSYTTTTTTRGFHVALKSLQWVLGRFK